MREQESSKGLWAKVRPQQGNLRLWQVGMLVVFFAIWHVLTVPGLMPPVYFDDANKAVSHAEAIKKFAILPVDWTEEGGQITPSLKLKRNVVMSEFAADVAALYS